MHFLLFSAEFEFSKNNKYYHHDHERKEHLAEIAYFAHVHDFDKTKHLIDVPDNKCRHKCHHLSKNI